MADYIMNEALLQPIAGWEDGSVNVLRPSDDRQDLKIMVLRSRVGRDTLESFARQQTKTLSQRMSWFTIVADTVVTVAGQPAYELRATFKDSGHELYQRRVMFAHGGKYVSIIVAGLVQAMEECDAIADRIVGSVQLRTRAA
jgi:hypothetical protein